uniref:Uncharacterized protein n=1 Tax=Lepeophtheirus salmonis TaxID=72036 RepID=A0A0K2VJM1_LEPSM
MFARKQNALRLARSVPGVGRWAILEYAVCHLSRLVFPSLST